MRFSLVRDLARTRVPVCRRRAVPPLPHALSGSHSQPEEPLRVYALTDVHTDYAENLAWIEALADRGYRQDLPFAPDLKPDLALPLLSGCKAQLPLPIIHGSQINCSLLLVLPSARL